MTSERISLLSAPRTRIAATIGVIGVLWFLLPVALPTASHESSSDTCLSMADHPPSAAGPDVLNRLEGCSALVPDDVELLADLADRHVSEGHVDTAETVYRRALAIDPDYADLRLRLAQLLLRRGAAAEAREQAALALRVQPNRRALRDIIQQTTAPRMIP